MKLLDEARRVRQNAIRLHTQEEVRERIGALARLMAPRLEHDNPIVLVIMTGGMFFATELCRHFDFPYELDYLHVWRYGAGLEGGALEWIARPRTEIAGRTVLLVDDVVDRGVTLRTVGSELESLNPAGLLVAVLASKNVDVTNRPAIDFVGFACPDRYLFGCGMDYKGFWRGLPALYAVNA